MERRLTERHEEDMRELEERLMARCQPQPTLASAMPPPGSGTLRRVQRGTAAAAAAADDVASALSTESTATSSYPLSADHTSIVTLDPAASDTDNVQRRRLKKYKRKSARSGSVGSGVPTLSAVPSASPSTVLAEAPSSVLSVESLTTLSVNDSSVNSQSGLVTYNDWISLKLTLDSLLSSLSCVNLTASNATDLVLVGCNVHITNGMGATTDGNGLGNLILGYNEADSCPNNCTRSGSHNLVVGTSHAYPSSGGFVAGQSNTLSGAFATVAGGYMNEARGLTSHVSGVSVPISVFLSFLPSGNLGAQN
jgi:hypothetical protein